MLLLLAILLLGILVRVAGIGEAPRGFNQDEASAGYDAFAILKYGIDRNGIHNPVHLIAWGSGQNAAYSWLCMPFIALLGLSVWSVRLPMALVGCVSLVIFYFLLKNIHRENKAFVLLGTFLFAIFPWHVMKSRWSLESNLFPDLVLWGTFLLSQYLRKGKSGYLYTSMFLLGFSAYSYGSAYCFLPFFVLPVGICLLLRKKVTWKQALVCVLVLGGTVLPILLFVFINTFDYPQIELGFLTIPRLYVNRHTEMASVFSGNFLESSLKNFRDALKILVTQEDGLPWNAMPPFGLTYRVTLPLTLWGLVLCLKNIRKRNAQGPEFLMDLWFAASVVLMFVVKPNINRINIIMIPWMYYTIAGTVDLAGRIPHGPKAAAVLFSAAFLLFAKTYFTDYQSMMEHKFSYGLGDAITQAAQAEADRFAKEQDAAGIRAVGEAEASAIQAKGLAEAEAMEKKAEAYAKYNKAAVAEMMIKVLPEVAGKIAEPLAQIDKITIIGGADGGNGVDQVAGNVPVVMAKLFESMKEATGIDLADIVNADSYDAKVNRNVNLTGLDNVNLVVSDNKEQKPEA